MGYGVMVGFDVLIVVVVVLVFVVIVGVFYIYCFGLFYLFVFMVVGMLIGVDGLLGLFFDNYCLVVNVGNLVVVFIFFDGGLCMCWVEVC